MRGRGRERLHGEALPGARGVLGAHLGGRLRRLPALEHSARRRERAGQYARAGEGLPLRLRALRRARERRVLRAARADREMQPPLPGLLRLGRGKLRGRPHARRDSRALRYAHGPRRALQHPALRRRAHGSGRFAGDSAPGPRARLQLLPAQYERPAPRGRGRLRGRAARGGRELRVLAVRRAARREL